MAASFSRAREWRAGALLALLVGSDGELASESEPCTAFDVPIEVYGSSRLLEADDERLELVRGQRLSCQSPRARAVLDALHRALARFPRERLERTVRVHVDPRLPPRQAPIAGIEVHVTSREILVARSALGELGAEAWQHELFHTLAAAPPSVSTVTRRLWLTLEEKLVGYLTLVSSPTEDLGAADVGDGPAFETAVWEELALPVYDPHPLAEGFTRALTRIEPRLEIRQALDCLGAPAQERSIYDAETLRETASRFVARCSGNVAGLMSLALVRWLPEPFSPWPTTGSGKATARSAETR